MKKVSFDREEIQQFDKNGSDIGTDFMVRPLFERPTDDLKISSGLFIDRTLHDGLFRETEDTENIFCMKILGKLLSIARLVFIQLKELEGRLETTFKVILNTENGINVYVFENPFTEVKFSFSSSDLAIDNRRMLDSFPLIVDADGKISKGAMVVGHSSSPVFRNFVQNQTFILLEEQL